MGGGASGAVRFGGQGSGRGCFTDSELRDVAVQVGLGVNGPQRDVILEGRGEGGGEINEFLNFFSLQFPFF